MRILIAISGCHSFEANGCHQVMRETWLPDVARVPDLDYKLFVGHGPCGFGRQNTSAQNPYPFGSSDGYQAGAELPADVVQVDCLDDYGHLTYKTQESLRWAAARDYDFVFRCFPDTYVRVDRLLACGFQDHDYHGDFRGEATHHPNYTSGGPGYWLSRKAYQHLLDAPILGVWRDDLTVYVEDLWVGRILVPKHGLVYFDDRRFINRGQVNRPDPGNDLITAHLSCGGGPGGTVPYTPELMRIAHHPWKEIRP